MEHHVGIDVSLELSSLCVLDATGKVICVFRRIPAGHSDASQPVIPAEASHLFRGIPATPE